jgi:hypothetical protein
MVRLFMYLSLWLAAAGDADTGPQRSPIAEESNENRVHDI